MPTKSPPRPSPVWTAAPPSTAAATAAPTAPPRTAVPTPSPAPTSEPLIYTVHVGDNLTIIADRFSTTAAAIQIANDLFDRNTIYAGQELLIPQGPPGAAQPSAPSPTPERGISHKRFLCPADQEPLPAGADLIGRSAVCRLPILSYRLGDGPVPLVLVGGIHGGYEWNTILLAEEMRAYLEDNPDLIPPALSIYIVPNANPDGLYAVTGSSGSFDPPTDFEATIPGRFNGRYVDLNRNWDCEWQPVAMWGYEPVNGGAAPFSEPETQALRDFFLDLDPAVVLFWHSAAVGVYASGCGEIDPASKAAAETFAFAAGYRVYDDFAHYEISGDAGNWLASVGIPAISVELTTHASLDWPMNRAGLQALMLNLAGTSQAE